MLSDYDSKLETMAAHREENKENKNMSTQSTLIQGSLHQDSSSPKLLDHPGNSHVNGPMNYSSPYK